MAASPADLHLYLMLTTGVLSLSNPNYFSHTMAPVTFGFFLLQCHTCIVKLQRSINFCVIPLPVKSAYLSPTPHLSL